MEAVRYDAVPLKATLTPEGYIVDSPVLGRTGVQIYKRADGRVIKEYRPPSAVFDPVFLASMRGRPIVNGHPGRVNAENVRAHAIGTVLSEGRQDGQHIRGDIIIHDVAPVLKGGKRELSLGYVVVVKDEAGTSPDGEHYDAIQERIISCDHLAVVERGRAGCAKLNLDGEDAAEVTEDDVSEITVEIPPPRQEQPTLADTQAQPGAPQTAARGDHHINNGVLVRVDGAEVSAPVAVARELERERDRVRTATLRADKAEAERDALQATVAKFDAEKEQVRLDAATAARARVKLEIEAEKHGIEVRSNLKDRDLREAVISKVRGDEARFDGKSDEYVLYAFDEAVKEAARAADQNARNRATVQAPVPGARADAAMAPHNGHPGIVSAAAARERMIRQSLAAR